MNDNVSITERNECTYSHALKNTCSHALIIWCRQHLEIASYANPQAYTTTITPFSEEARKVILETHHFNSWGGGEGGYNPRKKNVLFELQIM